MRRSNRRHDLKQTNVAKQSTAVLLSIALIVLPLSAQPTGAQVTSGTASFQNSANNMQITTSNKAIINYNSFNIGATESLQFIQPSVSSVVLNRVIMDNPSSILGSLSANGNVFLVNPAGIFFGAGSSVNANSFVATTLNISDNDFLNSNYAFNKILDSESRAIVQQGTISVSDQGFVVLAAPLVSNEGRIIAKAGHVTLGATDNFYIQFDAQGLIRYDYAPIENSDQPIIISESHANNIIENVLNTDALKSAVQVVKSGNSIILSGADGVALNSGTIDTGATADAAAGTIEIKAGKSTFTLDKSTLQSNAQSLGNGGVIDIFSRDLTYSDKGASYEAKGGTVSGNGGFVEVSAKDTVLFNGSSIDMQTVNGDNGLFLIDPVDLIIGSDFYSNGANLLYQADNTISVSNGVTLSTRQITGTDHLTGLSTGNSGTLTMEAAAISIGSDAKLLTFADSGFTSGDINLHATSIEPIPEFGVSSSQTANILIDGATLKGGVISIVSNAEAITNFSVVDADRLTDDNNLEFFIDKVAPTISTPYAAAKSTATASVTIGDNTNIDGDSITIKSDAIARSNTKSSFSVVTIAEGESIANATTTINSGATLNSKTDITINSTVDAYSKVDTLVQDGLAFSHVNVVTTSIAEVENGAEITATGDLFLQAENTKSIEVLAASEAVKGISAALSITDSESTTQAILGGTVNADNINVEATTNNNLIETTTSAIAGDPALFDRALAQVSAGASELKLSIEKYLKDLLTIIKLPKVGLSGAVSLSTHSSTTQANIANNADITNGNELNVNAISIYPMTSDQTKGIKTSAIASVVSNKIKPINFGVAAAVAVTDITNNVSAYIGEAAKVDSGGNIVVSAKTEMPFDSLWGEINDIEDVQDHLNTNLGVQDKVFTTWAQSSGQGDNIGIAGSMNHFELNNDTQAYIADKALINQNIATTNLKNVLIEAQTNMKTVNLAGVFGLLPLNSGGGKGGLGASYLDVSYNDTTKAAIMSDVQLNADALAVTAKSITSNISASVAGGKAETIGISGAVSNLNINNTTYADIQNATINLQSGSNNVIPGITDDNFIVYANDDAHLFNITGGIVKAENIGIGASASINNISRDTQANIKSSILNGNGNSNFIAVNSGAIDTFSLAGAVISESPPSGGEDAGKGAGKYGVGVSGDASVNTINDTAKVNIIDSTLSNGSNDLTIQAMNDSTIRSYSGSVAITTAGGTSVGLAGSYSQNTVNDIALSSLQGSTIDSKNLTVKAVNAGDINAYSASGSLAPKSGGVAIAGSVSINDITNTTQAAVSANSVLTAGNDIIISSSDTSAIKTVAGAASLGGKAGVGASFAKNNINNTLEASVQDSQVSAQNTLDVAAQSDSIIQLIVASIGGSTEGMAAAIAVGVNTISNNIKAWISGNHLNGVDAGTDVHVTADDKSTIEALAGGLAASDKASVGASALYNAISNTISSYIIGSDVKAIGNIDVHAKSNKDIKALSVGGAASAGASISGSVLVNMIEDTTNARISTSNIGTSGSISLEASEVNNIEILGGVLSGGTNAGIGVSVAVNMIKNQIDANIESSEIRADGQTAITTQKSDDTANLETIRGLDLIAYGSETIRSKVGNASAGGTAGIGGSVSVNSVQDIINSHIDGTNINIDSTNAHAAQDVRVRALSKVDSQAISGVVAAGGTAGGAGSSDTTIVKNTTTAYMQSSLIYAKKLIDVRSNGFNKINNFVISGAGAGTASLAGSVAVIDVNTKNDAYTNWVSANSDSGLDIVATDTIDVDAIAGALSVGGTGGVGGSVVVTKVGQDVKAHADSSTLNTKGTMNITSDSYADTTTYAATGALGGYLGAAGSVTINTVDASSQAYTTGGTSMLINQDASYKNTAQDVNVDSGSITKIKSTPGTISGGIAGVGASVDLATINNTVLAKVGDGSKTNAGGSLSVLASSDKQVDSQVIAFSVGGLAVSGAVSIVNINSAIDADGAEASATTGSTTNSLLGSSRVGTQLGDTTLESEVDAQTSSVNVTDQFDQTRALNNTVHAVIGNGASVETDATTSVKASDLSKIKILSGAAALSGVAGIGGSVNIARIGSDARAYIGDDATLKTGNLDISSRFESKDNAIDSYAAGASLIAAASAAVSKLSISYENDAYLGARTKVNKDTSTSANVNVKASTEISSSVNALGGAVGAVAGGAVISDVTQTGNTLAYLGNGSDTAAANLNVHADYLGSTSTKTQAASGGIVSGNGSDSSVVSTPTVTAEIKDNAKITVASTTDVKAGATEALSSQADGIAVAALGAGASLSHATWTPTVRSSIGANTNIKTGSLSLQANLNTNNAGDPITVAQIISKAFAAVGSLIGGSGAVATAGSDSNVETFIGAGSVVTTTQNNLDIASKAYSNVSAVASGHAYGGISAGYTKSSVINNAKVASIIGDDTTLTSELGNININAYSQEIAIADTTGGAGGLLSGAGTFAEVKMINDVDILVGKRSSLSAKNGDINILSQGNIDASSISSITTAGGITNNESKASINIDQDIDVVLDDNSKLDAKNINVLASVEKLHAVASAYSKTIALGSTSTAIADIQIASATNVHVKNSATLNAQQSLQIRSNHNDIVTLSSSNAKIDAGVTGSLFAKSNNDLTLDSNAIIDTGVNLVSNDVTIEAVTPKGTASKNMYQTKVDAEANTVIEYVWEAVDTLVSYVSWIPFVGDLVEWVVEKVWTWVEKITNSTVDAVITGVSNYNSKIVMNGTITQTPGEAQALEIAADGTMTKTADITAQVVGNEIVVDDLINHGLGKITLNTTGSVEGSGDIVVNNAYSDVTITNNSDKNLRINAINTISDNNGEANIQVTSVTNTSNLGVSFNTLAHTLNIENLGSSDILLNGELNNYGGNTKIYNEGGNIFSNSTALIRTKALDIASARGDIGQNTQRIEVELQKINAQNLTLVSNSFAKSYLGLTLAETIYSDTVNTHLIDAADLTQVTANGPIDLLLHSARLNRLDSNGVTHQDAATSTFNISNMKSNDNIDIAAESGVSMVLDGIIQSGVKDLLVRIDNTDPSLTSSEYINTITADAITLNPIVQRGGTTNVTLADGTLSGTGSITLLDGYMHVNVENATDKDLNINGIDTDKRINGGLYVNGSFVPFGTSTNGIAVNSIGYTAGDIAVNNLGTGTTNILGDVLNQTGSINISGNNGLYNPNNRLVSGQDVTFDFSAGEIGTQTNAINVAGILDVTGTNDINLHSASDLLVNTITGSTVSLKTAGSIIDTNGPNVNITANNLELVSVGDIAQNANPLNLAVAKITASSQNGAIYLQNARSSVVGTVGTTTGIHAAKQITLDTQGALTQENGADIISDTEGITLSSVTDMAIDFISALTDIVLTSTAGSITETGDAGVDIQADRLIMTAANGIGHDGTTEDAIDTIITTLDAKNTDSNNLVLANQGDLRVNALQNDGGDIKISTTGAMNLQGDVVASSAVVLGASSLTKDANAFIKTGTDFTMNSTGDVLVSNLQSGGDITVTSGGLMDVQGSVTASNSINLEAQSLTQDASSTMNAGTDVLVNTVSDILVSNVSSGRDIVLNSQQGDILGTSAVSPNLSANQKLTLTAQNGVVGTPTNVLSIEQGSQGVEITANGSKNLISVYATGIPSPLNGNVNLDLVALNNRVVGGAQISKYYRIQSSSSDMDVKAEEDELLTKRGEGTDVIIEDGTLSNQESSLNDRSDKPE